MYREELRFEPSDGSEDESWPITAEQVYAERFMFHGPAFQRIAGLGNLSSSRATADLIVRSADGLFASHQDPVLLTDPCVMDGVGQVVGLWAKMYDLCILPIGVDRVEFYCPPPPPGTVVPIRIEITEVNRDAVHMRSDVELGDGRGAVWARFSGWADFIMPVTPRYQHSTDMPARYIWAQELAPGTPPESVVTLLTREDFKGVNLEWTARLFLHARELAEYRTLDGTARQRDFLAARVVAKDAARLWLARRDNSTELRHPSTLVIAHNAAGRPYLEPGDDPSLPELSIAHTGGSAVAIASAGPVGIDLEPAAHDTAADLLPEFATPEEIALADHLAADLADGTTAVRLWCAKEAVSKAIGTGLQGRPKDFEAVTAEVDGSFLVQHRPTGERVIAHTTRVGAFVVACAVAALGDTESVPGAAEANSLGERGA
jgi:phosphopantetheinyl transferase